MAEGRSNASIAATLHISEGSVEKHVASIFGKLGLASDRGTHRRVLAVVAHLRS
jgi:DNA-binding NarL/FixJ family response regulator